MEVDAAQDRRSTRGVREAAWTDAPLQNLVRDELDKRGWNLSDLAREMGRAPSLISRWMQGTVTPSPESLHDLAAAFGVDPDYLLTLGGVRSGQPLDEDPRVAALIAKVRLVEWDDDRYAIIESALETMRRRPLTGQREEAVPFDHFSRPAEGRKRRSSRNACLGRAVHAPRSVRHAAGTSEESA